MATTISNPTSGDLAGEASVCVWCGSDDLGLIAELSPYSVRCCIACGVGFTDPQPNDEDLSAAYPDSYYPTLASPQVRSHLKWKRFDLRRVWGHLPDLHEGRFLDVGCGIGGALVAARERGFQPLGVEFSAEASRFGRDELGLDITTGTIDDLTVARDELTMAVLLHSLEHLRAPKQDLQRITSWIKPGGAIVIECPNIRASSARFFSDRWFHLEVPRHLFHFHPQAICQRLQNLGFDVLDVETFHPAHGAASFFGSLYPVCSGLPLLERVKRKAAVLAVRSLARPLARLEAWLGTGSIFRVVARKKDPQ